jgi:hypothetical protein
MAHELGVAVETGQKNRNSNPPALCFFWGGRPGTEHYAPAGFPELSARIMPSIAGYGEPLGEIRTVQRWTEVGIAVLDPSVDWPAGNAAASTAIIH